MFSLAPLPIHIQRVFRRGDGHLRHISNAQGQRQVIIAELEMYEMVTENHDKLAQSFQISSDDSTRTVLLWPR